MQYTYRRNFEYRSRKYFYLGKAVSIAYSELVFVALVIHHVKHTRRIILLSVACPALLYVST